MSSTMGKKGQKIFNITKEPHANNRIKTVRIIYKNEEEQSNNQNYNYNYGNEVEGEVKEDQYAHNKKEEYYENAEALGSYKVAEDGRWHYFEVVMADRNAPQIAADKNLKYLSHGHQGRAERGKTFAGRANKIKNLKNKRKIRAKKRLEHRFG